MIGKAGVRAWWLAGALCAALACPAVAGAQPGTISTFAGDGTAGSAGDGGPATQAQVGAPSGIAVGPDGSVFIAETSGHRVRRIAPDGTISTFAGTGEAGYSGDGGPATEATINTPVGLAVTPAGSLLIGDYNNSRVRRVATDGTITTFAGIGEAGFSGDGGPATAARIRGVAGIAVAADGSVLLSDQINNRVRSVASDGTITTLAGGGASLGDGGPATAATLANPAGVAVRGDGSVLIADVSNNRVRIVTDGTIDTFAGTGAPGFGGDGGAAAAALLADPASVTARPDGSALIADQYNNRVRRVAPDGTISTFAGTGETGYSGDGGPATAARLDHPFGVAVGRDGSLLITDQFSHRVRRIAGSSVSVGDVVVAEGAGSSTRSQLTHVSVPVVLDEPSLLPVTVGYATADDTAATAGGDYRAASGAVTIPVGETRATIDLVVVGDYRVEPDELALVRITSAAGASVADGEAAVTLRNDDRACGNLVERVLDRVIAALTSGYFRCE